MSGLQAIHSITQTIGGWFQLVAHTLLLGATFFLVITPVGILLRMFGKDSVRSEIHKGAGTYWTMREPRAQLPEPSRFRDQF